MYRFEPLNETHHTDFFDCGHDDNRLGEWLTRHGRQFHERNQARVWVMCEEMDVTIPIGYFALSSFQINGHDLTRSQRGGIPQSEAHPAQLLGKFALSLKAQGTTASTYLMREVFGTYQRIADATGTRFLALHARHEKLREFYMGFGFSTLRESNNGSANEYFMAMSSAAIQSTLATASR